MDLAFSSAGAARANGTSHADAEDEEDDDEEYEDDEGLFGSEQLFDTPLDTLDSYAVFSQVIQGKYTNVRWACQSIRADTQANR